MTTASRLLQIEFRRSLGLWLAGPLLVITLWTAWDYLESTIWLWSETSTALRNSTILLGPMVAAFSAWVAGRNRRNRLEDLLATVPKSITTRTVACWAGTAGWGVLVYLIVVLVLGVITAMNATWGWPSLAIILVGLASVAAHSAIGFAVGIWVPWRLTAPLVGIALFVLRSVVAYNPSAIEYLSPVPGSDLPVEVFYDPRTGIFLAQIVWLTGLTGVALGAALLPVYRTAWQWAVTAGTLLLAAASCLALIMYDGESLRGAEASYTPVCEDAGITVCLHPAYEPMMEETVTLIERLTAPIVGVPGALTRAEQRSIQAASNGWSGDTLLFELNSIARDGSQFASGGYNQFAEILTRRLVGLEDWTPPEDASAGERTQQVMANWLLLQAGVPLTEQIDEHTGVIHGFPLTGDQQAALDRFASLDDDRRRAWLQENYPALKSGAVMLENLP